MVFYYISHSSDLFQFRLGCQLGSGQFGEVYKGELETAEGKVSVAVKTLKEGASNEDRVKFLQEAAIMGQFKHPYVINMHGFICEGEPVRCSVWFSHFYLDYV